MSEDTAGCPLPNFLVIGAARCGTTTLYGYLKDHPDVYLPPNKRPEPHFFLKSCEYSQGMEHYRRKHFASWMGEAACGEVSTSYICHEWVAERIKKHLPDIKLVAALRNPVDRAWSNYWHTKKSGLETLTFEEALDQEEERLAATTDLFWREVRPYAYVERGFYHRQLTAYLNHFSRKQMHVVLVDDLRSHPRETLSNVLTFLDVDPGRMIFQTERFENASESAEGGMKPKTREKLIASYHDEIRNLERFLGRSLEHWLA